MTADALRMALAIAAHRAVTTLPLIRTLLAMATIAGRLNCNARTCGTAMTMAAVTAPAAALAAIAASGGRQLERLERLDRRHKAFGQWRGW